MHLNEKRGHGITILGAIGAQLSRPVFLLAKSTKEDFVKVLFKMLYEVVNPNPNLPDIKTVVVLDNHKAHKTPYIKRLA